MACRRSIRSCSSVIGRLIDVVNQAPGGEFCTPVTPDLLVYLWKPGINRKGVNGVELF